MPTLLLVVFEATGPQPPAATTAARQVAAAWDAEARDLHIDVVTVPRAYRAATDLVTPHLSATRPDLFLLYDTDAASPDYKLHQLAANYDDAPRPDATGEVRADHIIDPDGPVAYRSRLPLDGVWDKLLVEGVPVRMSHKADHVFNHVFYRALQQIETQGLPTRGGAIETPPGPDEAAGDVAPRDQDDLAEETVMILSVVRQLLPVAEEDG